MVVLLNREGSETPLADVPGGMVGFVVMAGMGGQERMHHGTQVVVADGRDAQMEVVGDVQASARGVGEETPETAEHPRVSGRLC